MNPPSHRQPDEAAAQARGAFAARLIEHLAVAAFVIDRDGRVVVWNRACERLTGVPAAEMIGGNEHWRALYHEPRPCLADLLRESRSADVAALYENWSDTAANPHGLAAENWCVMPRIGRRRYLAFDAGPIHDEAGDIIAIVETMRDLTAHKETEAALEQLAGHDPLTQIANRRTFDLRLAEEWRRADPDHAPLSLLMIDVDCFKQYNDAYGHAQGDRCLVAVAGGVKASLLRAGDVVARIGGEEFAVLLPGTPLDGALAVGARICETVAALALPHRASPVAPVVTVSIGAATLGDGDAAASLLHAADVALYRAKSNGRNTVEANPASWNTVDERPLAAE